MKTFRSRHQTLAVITALLLITAASIFPQTTDFSWQNTPPSEMHKKLAAEKALALDKTRKAMALAEPGLEAATTDYDIYYYDLNLLIDDVSELIFGHNRLYGEIVGTSLSVFEFDLQTEMLIDSIVDASYGLQTGYVRVGNVVQLTLPQTLNNGENFDFTVYYHGHPTEGGLQGFTFGSFSGETSITTLSEPYGARSWWPCKDRMDDKPDSMNLAIEVDNSFYVASNGSLDSTVQTGLETHTYYYSISYPIATYLVSLAISPYTVWYDSWVYNDGLDTMPLVHAVHPSLYSYSLGKYNITPYALTVLSNNFGLYPFVNEKYGHANFEWGGAMEHQTMTSMASSSFGFEEPVIVHEMTHQWWGDMITCKSWEDIWLNEGWASYGEAVYYYEKEGFNSYKNYMLSMEYLGGGTVFCDDTTDVWRIFSGNLSYDKGAWVCHMLRGVLGDSLFYDGIDAYYNSEFKYKAANTEDFKNVWEAATGVELDWFFEQWVYGTYYPQYYYRYWTEVSDTSGYECYLFMDQVQSSSPQVFNNPIQIVFDYSLFPSDTFKVEVDSRNMFYRFNLDHPVAAVKLDPNLWILRKTTNRTWFYEIITTPDEISGGQEGYTYSDTIEYRGILPLSYTEIMSGSLPAGLTLNDDGTITGTPTEFGTFDFSVRFYANASAYTSIKPFSITIDELEYIPGDFNLDGVLDVGDLVALVDYQFRDGEPPLLLEIIDVNGDCIVDVEDLVYMVDFQFRNGPAPLPGCAK